MKFRHKIGDTSNDNCSENNPAKYLLSPRWERIGVRGDTLWTFTPTLALPHRGGGDKWSQFSFFMSDQVAMENLSVDFRPQYRIFLLKI
jgi:hypothetical protein